MKKLLIASVIVAAILLAALVYAADKPSVYPVPGTTDMFKASVTVKNYEPYPAPKEDGKVGRLYGWVGGAVKTEEAKKFYIMKDTKITKTGGAAATMNNVKPDSVVLVTYKDKAGKDKKGDLEATELEIQ